MNKLEELNQQTTEGIILRSKCNQYEHGEKCSKYFIHFEKHNKQKSSIKDLINKIEITNEKDVLNQIKIYYENNS